MSTLGLMESTREDEVKCLRSLLIVKDRRIEQLETENARLKLDLRRRGSNGDQDE